MSEQQQARSEESLRDEYGQAVANIHHYSNLRFAVFSIFFVAIGGVGFAAFGQGQFADQAASVARIAGFPVIVIFWLYSERLDLQVRHSIRVAAELERVLGYGLFTTRPPLSPIHNWRNLSRAFFSLLTLLWAYAVIEGWLSR